MSNSGALVRQEQVLSPGYRGGLVTRDAAGLVPAPAGPPADGASLPAPSPIVKWAGGKGRLLSQLRPLLPPAADQRRHVEPFLGGGAMFFAQRPKRALLSDANPDLIATYRVVRDNVESLISALEPLAARHSKDHYYDIRTRYNAGKIAPVDRAAMFLYLNRTCFNGLHRVNRKGAFNVPFGRYKRPRIVHEPGLRAASAVLQGSDLVEGGFEHVLETARPGDFIYFDPPYVPLSSSANFTSYSQNGFAMSDQIRLRDVVKVLDRRGCHVMLSNSDTPEVNALYHGFRVDRVAAPRAISCDATNRKSVTEVVVRNYA